MSFLPATNFPLIQFHLGYLPSAALHSLQPHLIQLGAEAISEQVLEWNGDAERNLPYIKSHNVWGKRYDYDRLVTTEGWKQLGKWGARNKYAPLLFL